ncbi:hypothetical protein IV52_GL000627 [Fructilactobacillus lindneri DSM 20690 = JCM 11027]|uniref:Uncharacterized protein n=2 Tax=Fructilactobacillus lindneri TaxID=53444 RepID=A0A0R2JYG4_9LACO|nr:hypothetical protein IV52_GL000627 [Fructilactobacillus lindneri DSM 20690 = JCM 11027]
MWIVTAALWLIDKLMKRKIYKNAWADCGQIICFIDTVVLIFSFILFGCLALLGIYMPKELIFMLFMPVLIAAFIGGVIWKFLNK